MSFGYTESETYLEHLDGGGCSAESWALERDQGNSGHKRPDDLY